MDISEFLSLGWVVALFIVLIWIWNSLYIIKDIKQGDVITADAVRSVRPGFGLAPKFLDSVIGKKAAIDIAANTALTFALLAD